MFVVGNAIDCNDGRGFTSQHDKHMSALATVQPSDGSPDWDLVAEAALNLSADDASYHWITYRDRIGFQAEFQAICERIPQIELHHVRISNGLVSTDGDTAKNQTGTLENK